MNKKIFSLLIAASCLMACTKQSSTGALKPSKPSIKSKTDSYFSYPLTLDTNDPSGRTWFGSYGGFDLQITDLGYDYADYPMDVNGVPAMGSASIRPETPGFISQTYLQGGSTYFVLTQPAPVFNLTQYNLNLDAFQEAYFDWFSSIPSNTYATVWNMVDPAPDMDNYVASSYTYDSGKMITVTCKLIKLQGGQYALAGTAYPQPNPLKPTTSAWEWVGTFTDPATNITYWMKGSNGNLTGVYADTHSTSPVSGTKITGTYTHVSGAEYTFSGQFTRADGTTYIIPFTDQDLS